MTDTFDADKKEISAWWADNPMTYGRDHGTATYRLADGREETVELGSRAFFDLADETFYNWNRPRHTSDAPFGRIFDYTRYHGKPVLEVGCGLGCMAMNWAQRGSLVTAVDLNPVAVSQTKRRFELFELSGDIREADGEHLPFPDDAFAYAYSWGVLHHSPEPRRSIRELYRVLQPGAYVGVMMYHRRSLMHTYGAHWMQGVINLERRFLSRLELTSRYRDGSHDEGNPHTWPITPREARELLFVDFEDVQVKVFGTELDTGLNRFFPDLGRRWMPRPLIEALARRWGWSLWITARKPGAEA